MEKDGLAKSTDTSIEKEGFMSQNLSKVGIPNQPLDYDHAGIENISVEPSKLYEAVSALTNYGFNYLQCQGGYDEGPGKNLVSFYHFITVDDLHKIEKIQEVRLKVFLKRDSDLSIPSLYKIFKGSDWQERETYDMFGINFIDHPNPKRLLMPEDWRGWPLRKDYIQPDFYELQDAY
ncbi:NADH dehydrogenase subunit C [Prochlorococcus marinus str. MIT 9312]|uniref:NAD(P)H-quinone oxidoreductase subunit J n=1 Tax=Prochlorococcus marinus (strain MIT 9312) TaxID=74546 RepID=Q31CP0_PROM9|nr:NAD(P)H-quinone oxidoreductase subunit J [Prochlorococcus marinus]ABB49355.1 NADH dehydrogenase subunit C [Prochlorococcus marinus str. MIT 9312]KGG00879.1 NAD(P)H-quinone oxidoreductase chain J [Prochlorococcus marinus str. MIT 9311]